MIPRIENDTLIVPVTHLKALTVAASKDETRLHLQSLYYDRGLGALVCTDGHRMHVYRHNNLRSDGPGSLYRIEKVLAAMKLAGAKGEVTFTRDTICTTGSTLTDVIVQSTFPEWSSLIPPLDRRLKNEPFSVNTDYLWDLGLISKLAGRQQPIWHIGGPLDPIRYSWSLYPEWTAIIMPCRVGP